MKRFLILVAATVALFGALFLIGRQWGWLEPAALRAWLESLRESPGGGWLVAGVVWALLGLDLLLPVPSSLVMALAGMFFGAALGALVAFAGSMGTAALGFGLCRWGGHGIVERLVGKEELERVSRWFANYGVAAIVVSRPVPMLTEVLSCLAGLSDLRKRTFFAASVAGHLPVCTFYAYIGSRGTFDDPWLVVAAALAVPALGWVVYRRLRPRLEGTAGAGDQG